MKAPDGGMEGGSVSYSEYRAADTSKKGRLKLLLSRTRAFAINRVLFDILLYPYGVMRHKRLMKTSSRSQAHTYTCFVRSAAMLDVLVGPVLDRALQTNTRPIRILVFACSSGAEVYTIASVIRSTHPECDLEIIGSDLHQEMVDRAGQGRYTREEVLHSPNVTEQFLKRTFHEIGDELVVRDEIRKGVSFQKADLLRDNLAEKFGQADLVFCQNVLFHLDSEAASKAFSAVLRCLRPRGIFFVEGMDIPLKMALTSQHALQPFGGRVREIHEQARRHIDKAWWRYYYGSEPYCSFRRDRERRFGTVFVRTDERLSIQVHTP